MKTAKIGFLFLLSLVLLSFSAMAQQQVNIDQLTDQQLLQYMAQANLSGLSDTELEAKAIEKGMSPEQVQKLKLRMQTLNASGINAVGSKSAQSDPVTLRAAIPVKKPYAKEDSSELKVFGSELFSRENVTFEPNLQMATPKNYVVGTGDQLNIDIFGYSDASFKLKVSPDGNIRIPNSGPVKVAGLSFEDVQLKIKSQLTKIYPQISAGKTAVQVTLGQIRSIRVTLIGEVNKPGTYTLPSLATIANALYESGGPNKIGAYRNVALYRGGKLMATFDLYDFLLKGDLSQNLLLQDEDIIKVNPYETRVILTGAVKRKAIYETKAGDNLNSLLNIAGGFADIAFKGFIRVVRITQSQKEIMIVKAGDFGSFAFHSGDSCFVDSVYNRFSNRVVIAGALYHPGTYSVSEFPDLKGLLETAGLREEAYLKRGVIRRRDDNFAPQMLDFNVRDVLNGIAKINLQREDSIRIYSGLELKARDSVAVNGEVRKPGFYTFLKGMQLQDIILMAGGFNEAASGKRIEISRRMKDSTVEQEPERYALIKVIELNRDLADTKLAPQFELEPFDIVSVRKNPVYKEQIKVKIQGEVLYPGDYTVESKTETLSDLIVRAGGLRTNAFAEGAVLLRNTFSDSIEARYAENKMQSIQNQFSADSLSRNLIKSISQNRKIVGIRLDEAMANPHSRGDINLLEGDILTVPEIPKTVQSFGALYVPKKIVYAPGLTLKEVVEESGGFLSTASRRRTYIMYANGEIKTIRKFLFFTTYPKVKPGSEVYVPLHVRKYTVSEIASIGAASASVAALFISLIYLVKNL